MMVSINEGSPKVIESSYFNTSVDIPRISQLSIVYNLMIFTQEFDITGNGINLKKHHIKLFCKYHIIHL